MIINPIKTKIIQPNDDLIAIIKEVLPVIPENSILAVTSKVVSLWENRIVPIENSNYEDLAKKEADQYLARDMVPGNLILHTIKNDTLIGSAGIDRSRRLGSYILWPQNPDLSAANIHQALAAHYKIKNLGIIITDSHSIPLRRGSIGFCLGYYGFEPLKDYRHDNPDLASIVQSNIADGLASAAVVAMGEGSESTPLALISEISFVKFGSQAESNLRFSSYRVPMNEDLFKPFFDHLPWKSLD